MSQALPAVTTSIPAEPEGGPGILKRMLSWLGRGKATGESPQDVRTEDGAMAVADAYEVLQAGEVMSDTNAFEPKAFMAEVLAYCERHRDQLTGAGLDLESGKGSLVPMLRLARSWDALATSPREKQAAHLMHAAFMRAAAKMAPLALGTCSMELMRMVKYRKVVSNDISAGTLANVQFVFQMEPGAGGWSPDSAWTNGRVVLEQEAGVSPFSIVRDLRQKLRNHWANEFIQELRQVRLERLGNNMASLVNDPDGVDAFRERAKKELGAHGNVEWGAWLALVNIRTVNEELQRHMREIDREALSMALRATSTGYQWRTYELFTQPQVKADCLQGMALGALAPTKYSHATFAAAMGMVPGDLGKSEGATLIDMFRGLDSAISDGVRVRLLAASPRYLQQCFRQAVVDSRVVVVTSNDGADGAEQPAAIKEPELDPFVLGRRLALAFNDAEAQCIAAGRKFSLPWPKVVSWVHAWRHLQELAPGISDEAHVKPIGSTFAYAAAMRARGVTTEGFQLPDSRHLEGIHSATALMSEQASKKRKHYDQGRAERAVAAALMKGGPIITTAARKSGGSASTIAWEIAFMGVDQHSEPSNRRLGGLLLTVVARSKGAKPLWVRTNLRISCAANADRNVPAVDDSGQWARHQFMEFTVPATGSNELAARKMGAMTLEAYRDCSIESVAPMVDATGSPRLQSNYHASAQSAGMIDVIGTGMLFPVQDKGRIRESTALQIIAEIYPVLQDAIVERTIQSFERDPLLLGSIWASAADVLMDKCTDVKLPAKIGGHRAFDLIRQLPEGNVEGMKLIIGQMRDPLWVSAGGASVLDMAIRVCQGRPELVEACIDAMAVRAEQAGKEGLRMREVLPAVLSRSMGRLVEVVPRAAGRAILAGASLDADAIAAWKALLPHRQGDEELQRLIASQIMHATVREEMARQGEAHKNEPSPPVRRRASI